MTANQSTIFLSTKWVDYVEEPMKYQALRHHFFSGWVGWVVMVGWVSGGVCGVLVRDVVGGGGRMGGGIGDGVLSGWCAMGIIIFEGVLTKLNFLIKFPHLSKFIYLMKDLKYEHQRIFPCWEVSNLILGIGTENQTFFLRTPAAVKFLHQIF